LGNCVLFLYIWRHIPITFHYIWNTIAHRLHSWLRFWTWNTIQILHDPQTSLLIDGVLYKLHP
jgi:hypothetical protein